MRPKNKIFLTILSVALLALACGQFDIGIENPPDEVEMVTDTPADTPQSVSTDNRQTAQKQPTNTAEITPTGVPGPGPEQGRLDCGQFGVDPLVSAACNIQDSFISRNTQPLLGYLTPEFGLGYWQSEWTTVSPEYALESFQNYLLPPDTSLLTFTIDRSQFPPLFGIPVDGMLGPDIELALVIYSEGWGEDGQGAALIFITGNEDSGYQFPAFLIAGTHFDK